MSDDTRARILDLIPDPMDRVEAEALLDELRPSQVCAEPRPDHDTAGCPDLPATLARESTVFTVCRAAGLGQSPHGWMADDHVIVDLLGLSHDGAIEAVIVRHAASRDRIAVIAQTMPTWLLLAAIRTGQGGDDRG